MAPPNTPTASVVIPCYNAAAYLPETLAGIFGQSYADFEVILVDDGSTDDPEQVARRLGDPRLRFLRIPASGGPSRPRNVAIGEARGRIVFFCDSDDVMLPGKIERQVRMLDDHPELALTFTNFRIIDEAGRVVVPDFLAGYDTFAALRRRGVTAAGGLDREALYRGLLRANFIGTSSVAARTEVLREAGGFDTGLASSEDRDLWLRLARAREFGYVDIVGHSYRRRAGSVMRQLEARHPLARIAVFERNLPFVTDPRTRRVVRSRIASNYASLGYIWQARGDGARARENYLRSLRITPSWTALGGALKSLCGRLFLGKGNITGA